MDGNQLWEQINHRYHRDYYYHFTKQHILWQESVANDFLTRYNVKSLVDFGCGIGTFLHVAFKMKIPIKGFEYNLDISKEFISPEIINFIEKKDVSKPIEKIGNFDCSISFEVGEHISPELIASKQFVKNITQSCNRLILFTAAPPGQRSPRHINLRPKEFWIDLFQKENFTYLKEEVDKTIKIWEKINCPWYMIKNLMIFIKNKPKEYQIIPKNSNIKEQK